MKFLIILMLFISCCPSESNLRSATPKYSFHQKVIVYDGFYKGLTGYIEAVRPCTVQLKTGNLINSFCYEVDIKAKNDALNKIYLKTIEVSEEELTK